MSVVPLFKALHSVQMQTSKIIIKLQKDVAIALLRMLKSFKYTSLIAPHDIQINFAIAKI